MNRLKELREEAMMTVRELSERSGVSEDTITKIENAHRKGRGMTMRKLAKALNTTPQQLFPGDFGDTISGERASDIFAQDGLFDARVAGTRSFHIDIRAPRTPEAVIASVRETVHMVQASAETAMAKSSPRGPYWVPRLNLSGRQEDVLHAVSERGEARPSAVADKLGISVASAYRDLSVLEEHGLVQADESGERVLTPLGKDVVKTTFSDRDALDHIAALMKAYGLLAGVDPREATEGEAVLLVTLQRIILGSVGYIASAALSTPLDEQTSEHHGAGGPKRGDTEERTVLVQNVLKELMSNPPPKRVIQADIEGLSDALVLEALNTVQAAHRAGHGVADPYKNFRWSLTRGNRPSRRRGAGDLEQAPATRFD